jgi:hypothetical protein
VAAPAVIAEDGIVSAVTPDAELAVEGGEAPDMGAAGPPPKRVVHVPAEKTTESAASGFDFETTLADELLPRSLDALAAALEGDLLAVDYLMSTSQQCRGMPHDEEQALSFVKSITEKYALLTRRGPRRIMLFNVMPTVEENLAGVHKSIAACASFRDMWGDAREEVSRLARSGHVVARLLYALMPPQDPGRLRDIVPFEDQFGWEVKAREYSMANLSAGAPEGLLAYGYSYSWGLFTPSNHAMSLAFMIAAMDCSQSSLPSASFAASLVETWQNPDAAAQSDEASLLMSAQVRLYYEAIITHCR